MTYKPILKLALLSCGLGHVKRGIETWTEDLAISLRSNKRVDVTLYKGAGQASVPNEVVIPCLKRSLGLNKWLIKHRPPFCWRFGLATTYTLEETTFALNLLPELLVKQFDIIHTQDPDVAYILQKFCGWGLLRSKVILGHGTEEGFKFLKAFDYLQHLAPYHQQEAEDFGVKNKRAFAIGNFIDTKVFQPGIARKLRQEIGIPEDVFVVLSVAAIKKHHKRVDYLIDEVAQIRNEKVYLLVAGASENETAGLINEAKRKLGQRAVFLTDFPRKRIQEVYAAADVFVLCSLKEMMPIALLEALACGLPAIVNRYPVEEWMIGQGGDAIDMTKPGELSRAIKKYLDDRYKSEKSRIAREHVVRNFSKEAILEQYLQMYETVMRGVS
ncbi:MAG: glycosyltransferase family 4 protein, partial [Candidatus Omnitrophica bacterium]|nr:glycosyltransferase family 4 protein [Candidatus Omnitrophota bacterium]